MRAISSPKISKMSPTGSQGSLKIDEKLKKIELWGPRWPPGHPMVPKTTISLDFLDIFIGFWTIFLRFVYIFWIAWPPDFL